MSYETVECLFTFSKNKTKSLSIKRKYQKISNETLTNISLSFSSHNIFRDWAISISYCLCL